MNVSRLSNTSCCFAGNVRSKPFLAKTCSLIVAGTGKVKATLVALKAHFFTSASSVAQPPPLSLSCFPVEMVNEITKRLDLRDTLAFISVCSDIRGLYTPDQIAWSVIKEKCAILIDKHRLNTSEKLTLRRSYQKILTWLFDPKTDNDDIRRIAILAEKFYRHLRRPNIQYALTQVLQQQSAHNIQPQLEKLADINLHLCITLCCIAGFSQLAQYGVNRHFLLVRLLPHCIHANTFLKTMETKLYNSALYCAVQEKFLSLLPALLPTNPGGVDMRHKDGETVLMLATACDDMAAVRLLFGQKANINLQDAFGQTALMYACCSGKKDVVKVLLAHGADMDLQNIYRQTALMQAYIRGRSTIVRVLLQHYANYRRKTKLSRLIEKTGNSRVQSG